MAIDKFVCPNCNNCLDYTTRNFEQDRLIVVYVCLLLKETVTPLTTLSGRTFICQCSKFVSKCEEEEEDNWPTCVYCGSKKSTHLDSCILKPKQKE